MQALVLLFIGLCGVGVGVAGYFALTLTPIESALLGFIVGLGGWMVHERNLRHRAERRLEKALGDLRELLATDARAGHVLSQRMKALDDLDIGGRMEVIEADVSVLGTVVRQVAEAVSDLEAAQAQNDPTGQGLKKPAEPAVQGPTVPLASVRRALDAGRLNHHTHPVVTLPQRKLDAYHLVPRLALEDGTLADPPDYMPVRNAEGEVVVRRIERICTEEAIRVVRRGRLVGGPVKIWVDFSGASLADHDAAAQLQSLLSANRAVNPDICLAIRYADWSGFSDHQTDMLGRLVEQGVNIAIHDMRTLRHDFARLAKSGVRYVGVDAGTFIAAPARLTDFHSADINDYIERFGIRLVATGVETEEQILSLLDDGVKLAQGPAIAPPLPLRSDLRADEDDQLRSAAGQ